MLGDRPEVRDSHIGVVAHVSHEVVEFGCPRGQPGQERVVSAQHAPARRSFEDQAASAIGLRASDRARRMPGQPG